MIRRFNVLFAGICLRFVLQQLDWLHIVGRQPYHDKVEIVRDVEQPFLEAPVTYAVELVDC